MKEFTQEELTEVESLAKAFLKPKEICIVLGKPYQDYTLEFTAMKSEGEIYKAYQRGILKRKFELNKLSIEQAKAGSSTAMEICNKLSEEQIAGE